MGLPQLEESLCGCSLKTGSKIVGWWSLISRILIVLSLLVAIAALSIAMDDKKLTPDQQAVIKFAYVIAAISIVFLSILGLFSILLLVGVYQDRPSFMFAWICIEIIGIVFTIIGIILAIANQSEGLGQKIVQNAVSVCISIYCLLIVNSHYRNLISGGPTPSYS